MARIFQILNLENDELDHLAKLLGHDLRAERDYYRLPEAAVELAKIAKLLLEMEKGSLGRFKGRSMDEVEIEDKLELDLEQSRPDVCDAEEDGEESGLLLQQRDAAEPRGRRLTPEEDALQHIKARRDKPFLEQRFIDRSKGRGVFTCKSIKPSAFVVEFRGIISSHKGTRKKKSGDRLNNYLFDFAWIGTNWRVDASHEDGSLGRLVNDDHVSPNCEIRKIVCDGKPHLCLFAVTQISPGEELTYNYGDSFYPWRSTGEDSAGSSSSAASCDGDYVPPTNNDHSDSDSYDEDVTVDEKPEEDPSYTSKNYCYVCGAPKSKIARHLFTHRNEEPDIAAALKLRKKSKERKARLEELRERGNIKHNQEVLKTRCGKLKVRRKTLLNAPAKSLATCLYCKIVSRRKIMWRHMQRCPAKKASDPPLCRRTKVLSLVAVAESTDQQISTDVMKLLNTLRDDQITSEILSDSFILQMAQCLYNSDRNKTNKQFQQVKGKLRLLGRLLIVLKKRSICSFEEATMPQNFSRVVEAVREVGGFNAEKKSWERPGIMKSLGCLLKKIGDLNYVRALKEDAETHTITEAQKFVDLCEKELSYVPIPKSRVAYPPTVSFIRDVQLFHQSLEKTLASAVQSLTTYESSPVYTALLRVTLSQVSILNKNVPKVSEATLKSFKEQIEAGHHEDADVDQSPLEQILSKHTVKVTLQNTRGRKCAATLTPKLLAAITLLVNKRETCDVHENNPFLFAKPDVKATGFFRGHNCASSFAGRCGAENPANLRSPLFRKNIAKLFQILNLTNEDLDQLAKLFGRDIKTDREYYQTAEAAVDIAKISVLLSALEKGRLERFEGKSFEEIEIPDKMEPDVEPDVERDVEPDVDPDVEQDVDPEVDPDVEPDVEQDVEQGHSGTGDAEDNEESEGSLLLSGLPFTKDFSSTKKKSVSSSSRKRSGGRRESQESENELKDEQASTERGNGPEETPESFDVNTPQEKTVPRRYEDATNVSFSDDDDDMNVDFDMDVDLDTDDDVRNEDNDEAGDSTGSAAKAPLTADENLEEREDQNIREKKNSLSAALTGMKELKIVIKKLDVKKFQAPVHVSKLFAEQVSVKSPQNNQSSTPCTSTNAKEQPSCAKVTQMSCSHCKKNMMKGQTAYQKKGFTVVFCSKSCLFEMFPINKPATKTCHHCFKAISQPLDLIVAAVDVKGTMKDFCGVTCLLTFKSKTASTQKPQRLCSLCHKPCTATCELTLDDAVHAFCSGSCLEDFLCDKMAVCENCDATCINKPLKLSLGEETKTLCCQVCLGAFREKIPTPHPCTMCHELVPVPNMVDYKNEENVVELFCHHNCVTSYKIALVHQLQGKKSSGRLKNLRKNKQSNQKLNAKISRDSTVSKTDASAAESDATVQLITARSDAVCCECGKSLLKGETMYQLKSSGEDFCSNKCLSERHPDVRVVTKNCYNCFQVITRPHNMILAPVDDSGTMKELCGDTCLASVTSRRNTAAPKPLPSVGSQKLCNICIKSNYCKFKLTLKGLEVNLCSDACFIKYHGSHDLPMSTCDVCSSASVDQRFVLKAEDGGKTICSEECLVKFKETVETPKLCPVCQTSHQLSNMVENKNDEGALDFFCSNRCMMVHKAQSSTASGRNSSAPDESDIKEVKLLPDESDIREVKPSPDESDIKEVKLLPDESEVKPSIQILDRLFKIKEEPMDEEYNQNLPISTEGIKNEPKAGDDVAKEDLKIGSVFSLTGGSVSTAPDLVDIPASCSHCKQVLIDGETVYQRKAHADIFCSSPCLLKFYQTKQVNKTCHYCLQGITRPQDVLQAPLDNEGTRGDFCSQTCLSSFNHKRLISTKMPLARVTSQTQCSMCSRYCISKHEIIKQDVVHKICSEPCFFRFCNINNLSVCDNCHSSCDTPLTLKMEDGNKKLCSAECLIQFKRKIEALQPCAMCRNSCFMSDMIENKNSEDLMELFCTRSCVMASKIQVSGTPLVCDLCGKKSRPVCHLAMSDSSIRSFCTLTCAMNFKDSQKHMNANATGAANQTQCDFRKPPEKLPCAQCRQSIKSRPNVIQKKGKMSFVCGLACSQEFKRVNNITGKCEYCKSETIIEDTVKVDGKDCDFCSNDCKMFFRDELEKKWGEYCGSCAYCLCTSKTVVTATFEGKDEEFCSEDCSWNYNALLCCVAVCETCGCRGKLRQSLPLLGEVKHFCDLRCLLHFCNNKVQMVDTASSPPRSSGTVESSPIITNVISLASVLARQPSLSASSDSLPDIQTKVVQHAGIQTVSVELKNKSMLCTPLVHNKGVSCTTQSVHTETQTDNFVPDKVVLPVPLPVPVYVPLPLNMYSQYTPQPLALPLPLPVPVFLSEPTVKSTKETIQSELPEEELDIEPEVKKVQDERKEREDTAGAKDGQRQKKHAPKAKDKTPRREKDASRKPHKLKSQRGLDAWKRWTQWRKSQTNLDKVSSPAVTLNEDVLRCSAAELSNSLCSFITEVKRADGKPYSPDRLFYLCLSIQQHLFDNGRMENIFSDVIYHRFFSKFTRILKRYKPSITSSGYIHSRVEEEFLWDCKQLGAYSPIVLLNTLLFFCCKYIGFTTVEQHRQLSFAHVMRCTKTNPNNTKTTFLRFYPIFSIREPDESDADDVPAKKRKKNEIKEEIVEMMENTENPLRCPVRVYEFYLSKCSESVKQRTDVFYLQPSRSCAPSSPRWFSSTPLDSSTMDAMLVRLLAVRELQGGDDRQASHDEEDSE